MKNVSDLLKSEAFRENQLYPFLISKFKEGTIPTNINEFLSCCSFDEKKCTLKFYHKFDEYNLAKIEVLFGTSGPLLKDWTSHHLADINDIFTFDYDYLKIVIPQLDSIDRINRLTNIAGTFKLPNTLASIIWDGGSQESRIKMKYKELYDIAQERISQLKNQERKEQEEHLL